MLIPGVYAHLHKGHRGLFGVTGKAHQHPASTWRRHSGGLNEKRARIRVRTLFKPDLHSLISRCPQDQTHFCHLTRRRWRRYKLPYSDTARENIGSHIFIIHEKKRRQGPLHLCKTRSFNRNNCHAKVQSQTLKILIRPFNPELSNEIFFHFFRIYFNWFRANKKHVDSRQTRCFTHCLRIRSICQYQIALISNEKGV